ncbi:MAG: SpoIIE family protein phosphatase [Planctomycetota bacterium]|nr:SpoIIE family protein phosphatase [Planctomycetota bacterium]
MAEEEEFQDEESEDQSFLDFEDEDESDSDDERESWTILIVDDEPEIHAVTRLALEGFQFDGKPIRFVDAHSAVEARELIQQHSDTALVLLDVVMEEEDSGLQFVKFVREEMRLPLARIILRTGQPGVAPEESVILEYDINDYKAKTELTSGRLFASVVLALRGYRDLRMLEATRRDKERVLIELKDKEIEAAKERAEKEAAEAKDALAEELSIANKRMKRDLDAAAEIQRAFLPDESTTMPGVNIAWMLKSCDELAGDMLDLIVLDEDKLGLFVADVSGHGVPAALLSVTLSRVISDVDGAGSIVKDSSGDVPRIVPPSDVADKLNQLFSWNDSTQQYFTMVYGVLNTRTRELVYVAAGHPGPLVISADKSVRSLPSAGFPIGVLEEPFEQNTTTLQPGDRLFIFTDGLTETMNKQDKLFDREHLTEAVLGLNGMSLEESLQRLIEIAEEWRDGEPAEDDLTLLAVELE